MNQTLAFTQTRMTFACYNDKPRELLLAQVVNVQRSLEDTSISLNRTGLAKGEKKLQNPKNPLSSFIGDTQISSGKQCIYI